MAPRILNTAPAEYLSKAVTYDIAVSRDGPKIFANQYAIFILAPDEPSIVNMDNGHYYAVPSAWKHNKCNSLITVSGKCGLHVLRRTRTCTEVPLQGQPCDYILQKHFGYFNHIFRLAELHQCDQELLLGRFS